MTPAPRPDLLTHAVIIDKYFEAVRKGTRKGLTVRLNATGFVARNTNHQVQCESTDVIEFLAQVRAYRAPGTPKL